MAEMAAANKQGGLTQMEYADRLARVWTKKVYGDPYLNQSTAAVVSWFQRWNNSQPKAVQLPIDGKVTDKTLAELKRAVDGFQAAGGIPPAKQNKAVLPPASQQKERSTLDSKSSAEEIQALQRKLNTWASATGRTDIALNETGRYDGPLNSAIFKFKMWAHRTSKTGPTGGISGDQIELKYLQYLDQSLGISSARDSGQSAAVQQQNKPSTSSVAVEKSQTPGNTGNQRATTAMQAQPITPRSSPTDVQDLQRKLNEWSRYNGRSDVSVNETGKYDNSLSSAVFQFKMWAHKTSETPITGGLSGDQIEPKYLRYLDQTLEIYRSTPAPEQEAPRNTQVDGVSAQSSAREIRALKNDLNAWAERTGFRDLGLNNSASYDSSLGDAVFQFKLWHHKQTGEVLERGLTSEVMEPNYLQALKSSIVEERNYIAEPKEEVAQKTKAIKRKPVLKRNALSEREFVKGVEGVAERLGTTPENLLAVMHFESLLNPADVNRASGATGLIGFLPSTCKEAFYKFPQFRKDSGELMTGKEMCRTIAQMSGTEQLPLVEHYIRRQLGGVHNPSLRDLYMAVLWPKAVGKGEEYVLFKSGSIEYRQNSGLDINRDGEVTASEAASKAEGRLSKVRLS